MYSGGHSLTSMTKIDDTEGIVRCNFSGVLQKKIRFGSISLSILSYEINGFLLKFFFPF